ncbi:DNA polymerase III subunit delta [Candidatus Parcubacteria bacterium]|nr:DNA polymerase III subunit delta [Candidatus Parcubacteria bacterium]
MIIFLYGENTFQSREKLKAIKDKFIKEVDPNGISLLAIDGETAGLERINEAVATSSLFSKRRLIVIERIFNNKDANLQGAVEDYFKARTKDKADDNIIVFWDEQAREKLSKKKLYKFLVLQKFAQEFKPLSNTEASAWLGQTAKKRGGVIRGEAAVRLTSFFGSDLWLLSNELNKLIAYKRGQTPGLIKDEQIVTIEITDVDSLSRGSIDENIFALTDAISVRNKPLAIELFENELAAGVTEGYLIAMMTRQFKILLQIKEALEQGLTPRKIMSRLKLHPFVVQKSSTQARNFSENLLKQAFSKLLQVDSQMKTGQVNAKVALNLLIAKL